MLSDGEKSLINTVRELNYSSYAEPVIRLMAGLNATATSVEDWINENGALRSQLALAGEAAKTDESYDGDHPEDGVVGGQ